MSGVFRGEFHHFISSDYTLLPNQYFERHNIFGKDLECLGKCPNLCDPWNVGKCLSAPIPGHFISFILSYLEEEGKKGGNLIANIGEHLYFSFCPYSEKTIIR